MSADIRFNGAYEMQAGGPIDSGVRIEVDSAGRVVRWTEGGFAIGTTVPGPAGRAEKAGDFVLVRLELERTFAERCSPESPCETVNPLHVLTFGCCYSRTSEKAPPP